MLPFQLKILYPFNKIMLENMFTPIEINIAFYETYSCLFSEYDPNTQYWILQKGKERWR